MANPFYTYSGAFIPGTLARAEQVGTEYSSVQAGFALLAIQGTDSGAANAYVVTTNSGRSAYADGNIVEFKAANSNTGACTINADGIGVVGLTAPGGSSLAAGAITAGTWYRALYNSTYSAFTLIAPIILSTTSNTISSAAPPKVGLVAAGGVSTACVPIDAVYALDQSIAPTWTGAHIFANAVTFNSTVAFTGGLALTGGSSQYAATLTGNSSAGHSLGLEVNAGINVSDIAFLVNSQSGGTQFFEINGGGGVTVGAPTGGAQGVGTINATGLFVNGAAVKTTSVSSANPSASVGLAAVNGVAATFMTSDSAPALSQAIAPTWTGAHVFTPSSAVKAIQINAAINTIGLNITGGTNTANSFLLNLQTGIGSGFSSGLSINAGTTSADQAFRVRDATSSIVYAVINGDGSGSLGYNGSAATLAFSATGNVAISAPSSGIALTATGPSGNYAAKFIGNAAAGNSFGAFIAAGSNSSDEALLVREKTGTTSYFSVRGDGVIQGMGPVAATLVDMTPDTGTTVLSITGIGSSTAVWSRNGNQVTMCLGTGSGTPPTNGTALLLTGIPAPLLPARTQHSFFDSAVLLSARGPITPPAGGATIQSSGTFTLATFGTSTLGTPAGIQVPFNIQYLLN